VPGHIIDGKAIAAAVRADVRRDVDAWTAAGNRPPYLAVVLVGDDPASAAYVRGKTVAAAEAGIRSDTIIYDDVSEDRLLEIVHQLNEDDAVDGILVQLPLPDHVNESRVIHAMDPNKDVDGFHPQNVGRLSIGESGFVSATPAGIMEMLRRSEIQTEGRHAVVIGRSNIVGRPVSSLLLRRGIDATVTTCHSRTRNLPEISRQADILIAAIGRAEFVTADMVKDGAVVIDVGINRVEDNTRERGYRLVGDVAFESVRKHSSAITPVPGGVGPMTIAMLLKNTLAAARGDYRL